MQRMDENPTLFYLSGVLSFLLFSLFLFLFINMLFSKNRVQTYGLVKKEYISISLEKIPDDTKTKKDMHRKNQIKKEKKVAKIKKRVKRDKVDAISENVDIDSLFSNVWTKKIDPHKKVKRKVESKRIAEIAKEIDSSSFEIDSKQNDFIKRKKRKKSHTSFSAKEVNEYSAKIHAIVYRYFFPPPNSQGEEVKAVIELSPFGKMLDFRVLNFSANEALNDEVKRIKERIKNIIFPKNPYNEKSRIIIILKPEEKE